MKIERNTCDTHCNVISVFSSFSFSFQFLFEQKMRGADSRLCTRDASINCPPTYFSCRKTRPRNEEKVIEASGFEIYVMKSYLLTV